MDGDVISLEIIEVNGDVPATEVIAG